MSFHRVMIAALAALFVTGTASVALAGCVGCGWSGVAPFAYPPAPLYVSGGCGGCGSLAVTYAPPVYAPPAFAPAPPPIAPAPIAVDHWDTGGWGGCGWGGCGGIGCGCGSCGCGRGLLYGQLAAPAPIYVVNQGPEYSGPGIMVPYHTYSPQQGFVAPYDYPYISGPGYGYGHRYGYGYHHGYAHPYYHRTGQRFAYGEHGYVHPHHYGYGPTGYGHRYGHPHRPVGMRNY